MRAPLGHGLRQIHQQMGILVSIVRLGRIPPSVLQNQSQPALRAPLVRHLLLVLPIASRVLKVHGVWLVFVTVLLAHFLLMVARALQQPVVAVLRVHGHLQAQILVLIVRRVHGRPLLGQLLAVHVLLVHGHLPGQLFVPTVLLVHGRLPPQLLVQTVSLVHGRLPPQLLVLTVFLALGHRQFRQHLVQSVLLVHGRLLLLQLAIPADHVVQEDSAPFLVLRQPAHANLAFLEHGPLLPLPQLA
jgi:hypothetical protein